MAEKSTHYNLDILKGNDIYNPNITFSNFEKIDTDMFNIDTNSVHTAVHALSGDVNTLTRTDTNFNTFKFVATSSYTEGQTFTVDGTQVTAYTTNGRPLESNCYVIGTTVLCFLNGTNLTLYVRSSTQNSLNLNGHPDTYFAIKGDTKKTLKDVDDIATLRNTTSNSIQQDINKMPSIISFDTFDSSTLTINNGSQNGKYYILFIYSKGSNNINGTEFSINYIVTAYDNINYKLTYTGNKFIDSVILSNEGITFNFIGAWNSGIIISKK